VRAVVLALDVKRVVLIGHSMGGPVALEAARRMPERVVAVIGVDTFHDVERHVSAVQADALLGLWQNDYAGASHKFVESLVPPDADPAIRQRLETQFASASPDVSLPILRATFAYDLAAGFDRVHAPIRAINTSLATNVEADRRHSADFAVVDLSAQHLGHFPMLTAPALFDQQLAEVLNGLGVPTTPVAVPVPPGAAAPAPPPHPAP
jgi:pimeloyl-ACP methyl ester carboxylesterase